MRQSAPAFIDDRSPDHAVTFDLLSDIIGREQAIKLCGIFGGQVRYFPATVERGAGKWLVEIIGHDDAEKLCRAFRSTRKAGADINLPRGERQESYAADVFDRTLRGASASTIARELGITERTVFRWRTRLKTTQQRVYGKAIRALLKDGWSDRAIAEKLNLMPGVVKAVRGALKAEGWR